MKFDSVELERIVRESLRQHPQWRPASHKFVRGVEAAAFGAVIAYWLFGLISVFM